MLQTNQDKKYQDKDLVVVMVDDIDVVAVEMNFI